MNSSKWNDNRKTDAFKSTMKEKDKNKNKQIARPTNIRVWKNKTRENFDKFNKNDQDNNIKDEERGNNIIEPRKWKGKPRGATHDKMETAHVNDVIEPRKWKGKPRGATHDKMETAHVNDVIEPRKWKGKPCGATHDKMETAHVNDVIEPRKWKGEPRGETRREAFGSMNSKNTPEPLTIDSKWTAAREKRTEPNNLFSTDNMFTQRVPEKKSFNKKIVIIEIKSRKQEEAEKKAIYDSFIKESFILKVGDHLGKKEHKDKDKNKGDITIDSWNSDNGNTNFNYSKEHLTDFDKWEKDLLDYVDGDSDDYETVNKRRNMFFSGFPKKFYEYYKLPKQDKSTYKFSYDKSYSEKQHQLYLMSQLRGLSVLPAIMIEDTQEHIDEAYKSLYELMISKRMNIGDISWEYNVNKLLKIEDRALRNEFNKLRKKYNSIKNIQKKFENKEKVQNSEQDKYNNRHETIFLYYRLKYYDEYYMDGKLKFVNTLKFRT
jgi:hypothetical protein